ncbi:MAG: 23S rRNA (guanosine(2251)-2'-O)-methyltransferase RlmB [Acidobacteria bacterium]|nr:23S rRNA (guanosine(2251)-2'-O)-methyltransferase RlmB [Acidobacteriota bacterium]
MNRKKNFGRSDVRRTPEARPRRGEDTRTNGTSSVRSSVYGVLPVLEALRANARKIERIIVVEGAREHRLGEIFDLARSNGLRVDRVKKEDVARIVPEGANHQGIVALTASASYASPDEILDHVSETPLLLLLDSVQDPGNLGAILRTAECAGAEGVFITERRSAGLTEAAAKTSAGAIEYVKVAKTGNLNRLIEELKEKNVWVVGTSADAKMDYTEWDWTRPSALVMGGEGTGLHRLVAENCDVLVSIPMYGKIESLNVSVATGVILFEARRQRDRKT